MTITSNRLAFLLFIGVAMVGGIIFINFRAKPSAPAPADKVTAPRPPAFMRFTREGLPGKIAGAIDPLARPLQVAAALCEKPGWRLACIVVEGSGPEKYCQLDHDLTAEQFPFLKEQNFIDPPFPVGRTISRYRSVAKTAMKYNETQDRLIVLICPKSDWEPLQIACPELHLPQPQRTTPPVSREDPNSKERF